MRGTLRTFRVVRGTFRTPSPAAKGAFAPPTPAVRGTFTTPARHPNPRSESQYFGHTRGHVSQTPCPAFIR